MLKKNVCDTLNFLHQERNDFLPEDDIIIPSRKDDHVSDKIDLDAINSVKERKRKVKEGKAEAVDLREMVEEEVKEVISEAEEVVRDLKGKLGEDLEECIDDAVKNGNLVKVEVHKKVYWEQKVEGEVDDVIQQAEDIVNSLKKDDFEKNLEGEKNDTDDTLENLESLNEEEKSAEAFKFLENEASSPLICNKPIFQETANFVQNEKEMYSPEAVRKSEERTPTKSGIPVSKSKKKEKSDKEKDIDLLFSSIENESSLPNEQELLSKIPVNAKGKVKTIKKHSKDPLKEFVKLSQDVNWDDDETTLTIKTQAPIVQTTITRITSDDQPQTTTTTTTEEHYEVLPKSKIPVLITETTRIVSPDSNLSELIAEAKTATEIVEQLRSPGSQVSFKSSGTVDSEDEEDDSYDGQPTRNAEGKKRTTVGSSSGSDVALHEAGGELSEDESGRFSQRELNEEGVLCT